jgi:hypothetical protein
VNHDAANGVIPPDGTDGEIESMSSSPSNRFPKPEAGVDEIVRAQLDAEAVRVDAAGMWANVLTRLEAEAEAATAAEAETPSPQPASSPSPQRNPALRRFAIFATFAGLAAAIIFVVFFLGTTREVMASPAEVVQDARTAHSRSDRCYTQTIQFSRGMQITFPLVSDGEHLTVCVRGNRFVVDPGFGGKGAWGRDETGRIWVAPNREAAARFEESELPVPIRDAAKIRGLELDTLLDDVLKDFDLEWNAPPTEANFSIKATRRGAAKFGQLVSADLVIEKNTKLVKSLTLRRQLGHEANVIITFTFTGATEKDPAAYTAEGHVDRADRVYDATRPLLRGQVIAKLLKDRLLGNP